METNKAEGLNKALATLSGLIAQMHGFKLHETAQFLAMAKLHLLMDINGISEFNIAHTAPPELMG